MRDCFDTFPALSIIIVFPSPLFVFVSRRPNPGFRVTITHANRKSGTKPDDENLSHPPIMPFTNSPWNKSKAVGQKRPFTLEQIALITRHLEFGKQFRNLCLFCLGIDTMLRSSDLVQIRVSDLMDVNGHPKSEILWRQTKTKNTVHIALSPYAISTVCCHVASNKLRPSDFLFTAERGDGLRPLSTNFLRRLVKQWAVKIGLDPEEYAGHSLRRSKPAFMYQQGVQPASLRLLLGQKSLESTQAYLGIDHNDALRLARQYDCFREK